MCEVSRCVRRYLFLFTMQDLAEELEDLHDTVDDVLAVLHKVMGSECL